MLKKIIHILSKAKFLISALAYYVLLLGFKVIFHMNFINRYTALLIPLTAIIIYLVWNLFYNENLSDEMYDNDIKDRFFDKINGIDKKNIENLISIREDIQKLSEKANLNLSKQALINDLTNLNLNEMIEKYAVNSVKIKFIDDFIGKRNIKNTNLKDKIEKLAQAKERYKSLNNDIYNTFEEIQAQTVLILTDDSIANADSNDSLGEIKKKIEIIDNTNNDINNFYGSINKERNLE